jgi:hypothetical protein
VRALFSGRWGDTYLFDIIIGGLKDSNKGFPKESVDIVMEDSETSRRAGAMASARHGIEPVEMTPDTWPQVVFVCHDKLPADQDELDLIALYLDAGVPVYHIRHMDRETVRRLRSARRAPPKSDRVPVSRGAGKKSRTRSRREE